MEMNGALAATSLCFDYHQTRLLYNSGYDPGLSYFSVGLLLHAMCVKDAIEQGLKYFDFCEARNHTRPTSAEARGLCTEWW